MNEPEINGSTITADIRSNIYKLLAQVYAREVTGNFLQQLRTSDFREALHEIGVELSPEFFTTEEAVLLENLAVEYARLFLGPGKHISPHESVHHKKGNGQAGVLWGEACVQIKELIESSGVEYAPGFTGIPDHISAEFEFMHLMTSWEERAGREMDEETIAHCREIESRCVNEHLSRWIPSFCEKIIQSSTLSFYREMADLTRQFIALETDELSGGVNLLKGGY